MGEVVSLKEEVTIGSVPNAARAVLGKAVGNGKLQIERIKENGKAFYEASDRIALALS